MRRIFERLFRRVKLAAALAACAATLRAEPRRAQDAEPAKRPNVVLVVIDTLRPDHLELHGYGRSTAPFLNELGARAAVFDRALSASSWTAPATASVMTGLYPTSHGVTDGMMAHEQAVENAKKRHPDRPVKLELNAIPQRVATIAELFREAGYRTIGRSSNVNVDEVMGYTQGFDGFENRSKAHADELTDGLIESAGSLTRAGPVFLYLHLNDVHMPYERRAPAYAPPVDSEREDVARYDSEIRAVDDQLRKLHDALGWAHDTVLLICSDHGEEFMEHGQKGHRFSLHYELNRVLFLVAGPGIAPRRVEVGASLVDVLPTLVELAGLPASDGREGVSLAPLLREPADAAPPAKLLDRPLFAHRGERRRKEHLWGVQRGNLRMIALGNQSPALYDFVADPGETKDLAALVEGDPALRRRYDDLLKALDSFRSRGIPKPEATGEVILDDAKLEELRALGYVDDK